MFDRLLQSMQLEDLYRLEDELKGGARQLQQCIRSKINDMEHQHDMLCVSCGVGLQIQQVDHYTLVFGPHEFRKKASFCGIDCLNGFIRELEVIQHKRYRHAQRCNADNS